MKKLLFSLLPLLLFSSALAEESASLASTGLMAKGLIVTVCGLCGVFLVLLLFFLMIKIMGKLLK